MPSDQHRSVKESGLDAPDGNRRRVRIRPSEIPVPPSFDVLFGVAKRAPVTPSDPARSLSLCTASQCSSPVGADHVLRDLACSAEARSCSSALDLLGWGAGTSSPRQVSVSGCASSRGFSCFPGEPSCCVFPKLFSGASSHGPPLGSHRCATFTNVCCLNCVLIPSVFQSLCVRPVI